jgi:ubiquinone/menaquinone biosynthesis C-methylase UbiE
MKNNEALPFNFWKKYFKVYDVLNLAIPYQELIYDICNELDIKPNDLILDAGCGTGNLAVKIHEKGANVIGLDREFSGLVYYKTKDSNANVVQATLTEPLPFKNNCFDKIVLNNVIYTIDVNLRYHLLREFYRILKVGGKIVISNPKEHPKPINIYLAHIKKGYHLWGLFRLIINMMKISIPTVKMFYYNFLIQHAGLSGNYSFMGEKEQKEILSKANFTKISKNSMVYANQAIMNSAIRE